MPRSGLFTRRPEASFHESPAMEAKLRDRFRPEVEKLEVMLGRDLSMWKWGSAAPAAQAASATR